MEQNRFDDLTRSLVTLAPRRAALRALAGGALSGLLAVLPLADADARGRGRGKPKGKKKKKGQSFVPPPPPPAPPPCGGTCGGTNPQCCPPTPQSSSGVCTPADAKCCTVAEGGGACSAIAPKCCAPTTRDPAGSCTFSNATCCTSSDRNGGGECAAFGSEPAQCCPAGSQVACCRAAVGSTSYQCCPQGSYSDCAPKRTTSNGTTFDWRCCPAGSNDWIAPIGPEGSWHCCRPDQSPNDFCHPTMTSCSTGCCPRSGGAGVQAAAASDADRLTRLANVARAELRGQEDGMNGAQLDRESRTRQQ